MLSIAAAILILGDGTQQYSCAEYVPALSKAIEARYEKPYLSPPEAKEFAGKSCKVHVEISGYGRATKVEPSDCSPMQITAANKAIVGVQFPVQQAPGCGAANMDLMLGK